jgi:hypothetical protein
MQVMSSRTKMVCSMWCWGHQMFLQYCLRWAGTLSCTWCFMFVGASRIGWECRICSCGFSLCWSLLLTALAPVCWTWDKCTEIYSKLFSCFQKLSVRWLQSLQCLDIIYLESRAPNPWEEIDHEIVAVGILNLMVMRLNLGVMP